MEFSEQFRQSDLPRVLVIEDNADQWFLIRWALLNHFSNINVVWLSTAPEVLPYLDTCRRDQQPLPSVILIDLYLPRATDGLHVLQSLKTNPHYKTIPVVVLSWSNQLEDRIDAFQCAANAYIVKPANYQQWGAGLMLLEKFYRSDSV